MPARPLPASPLPALLTPFVAIGRELHEIVAERVPMLGSSAALVVLSAVFLATWSRAEVHAAVPASQFELDFQPGALARIGVEPQEIPQKPRHDATHASGEQANQTVTDTPTPTPPDPLPTPNPDPSTAPKTHDQGKPSDRERPDTNPYHEANTDADPVGDPLGDAQGWADAYAAGDPWATGVMKALANMKVPGYAGKLPDSQAFGFKLEVCKTGKTGQVLVKQSTGKPELDAAIKYELSRLTIPKPPPEIAAKMPTSCVMLKYQFAWSPGSIR